MPKQPYPPNNILRHSTPVNRGNGYFIINSEIRNCSTCQPPGDTVTDNVCRLLNFTACTIELLSLWDVCVSPSLNKRNLTPGVTIINHPTQTMLRHLHNRGPTLRCIQSHGAGHTLTLPQKLSL
jgi:hypothetical protein